MIKMILETPFVVSSGSVVWAGQKRHRQVAFQNLKRVISMKIQGDYFLTGPSVQYRNENISMSQSELLFHEILHLREPLVGSIAFVHSGS